MPTTRAVYKQERPEEFHNRVPTIPATQKPVVGTPKTRSRRNTQPKAPQPKKVSKVEKPKSKHSKTMPHLKPKTRSRWSALSALSYMAPLTPIFATLQDHIAGFSDYDAWNEDDDDAISTKSEVLRTTALKYFKARDNAQTYAELMAAVWDKMRERDDEFRAEGERLGVDIDEWMDDNEPVKGRRWGGKREQVVDNVEEDVEEDMKGDEEMHIMNSGEEADSLVTDEEVEIMESDEELEDVDPDEHMNAVDSGLDSMEPSKKRKRRSSDMSEYAP